MGVLDFLFVSECKLCRTQTQKGSVCAECDKKLRSLVNVSERRITVANREIKAKYVFEYKDELVKKLLFALKRNADKELFVYASHLYELAIDQDYCGIVTNVPRRSVSKREYGYDHVKEPCKLVCKRNRDRLMYSSLVSRHGFSKDQKNLSLKERENNIKGKFRAKRKDIRCDILLVDDVVTTGNTVTCCAEEIIKANPDANLKFVFLSSRDIFPGNG